MVKRIATHRVYDVEVSVLLCQQAVELDDEGVVCRVFPLQEEMQGTEWLPGMVVLSPFPPVRERDERFGCFVRRITLQAMEAEKNALSVKRAYWIDPFNVSGMEFLPSSRIKALR